MHIWLKTGVTLAALWALAAGSIYWLHHSQPTAASVTEYLAHTDLSTKSGRDRASILRRVEDQLNDLTFDERQQLRRSGVTARFFAALSADEQAAFLDATLPTNFKQLMEAFNKMDPARRKEIVARAVEDMKAHEGETPVRKLDEKLAQRVIDQGLKSFYQDASADSKLDLAPLIEQMQRNLQAGGQG